MGVSGGLHLFIRNWRQTHAGKYRLQRAGGFITNGDHVLFTHRPQAAIDLQIALDHVVVVEVFGIFVRTGEHVVVVRHRRVTGGDKVGAWQELHQQARGTPHIRVGKGLIVTGGALQIQR